MLRKTRAAKSRDYHDSIVFEKPRFRDVLVWTVGLAVEIKLRFLISAVERERCLSRLSHAVKQTNKLSIKRNGQ